ncbi:9372_t:CDS:10 [Diversispora eburnea]|uniref:9372_t:CDS:1 n=1 Tax=Diversispora eburnea TaxID=1213867 RepID=A0A9N8UZ45_9GLOM|nr:9372_t:CDS:10 [Diversispora eburnea]
MKRFLNENNSSPKKKQKKIEALQELINARPDLKGKEIYFFPTLDNGLHNYEVRVFNKVVQDIYLPFPIETIKRTLNDIINIIRYVFSAEICHGQSFEDVVQICGTQLVRKEKDHTPFAFMEKNGQIYRHLDCILINKNIDISNFHPIFQELIHIQSEKSKGTRYHPMFLRWAISVYNRSGHAAYNTMKVIMRLPSISTLKINEKNCYVGYLDFENEMHEYHTFALNCQQEIESISKNNNSVFNEQKQCIEIRTIGSVCDGAGENRTHIKSWDWIASNNLERTKFTVILTNSFEYITVDRAFIHTPMFPEFQIYHKTINPITGDDCILFLILHMFSKSHTGEKNSREIMFENKEISWKHIKGVYEHTKQTLSKEVEDALESIDELNYISDKTQDFIKYSRKYRQIMHSKLIFRSLDDPSFTTLKEIRDLFVYGTIRELGGDSSTQTLKSYGHAVNKYQVTALVSSEIKSINYRKVENIGTGITTLKRSFHLEVYLNNYRCSGVWCQDFLEATHLNGSSTQRLVAFLLFQNVIKLTFNENTKQNTYLTVDPYLISGDNINLEPTEVSKFVYIVGWIIYKLIKSNTMKSHPKFEAMSAHLKVLSSEQIVYERDVRIQTTNIIPVLVFSLLVVIITLLENDVVIAFPTNVKILGFDLTVHATVSDQAAPNAFEIKGTSGIAAMHIAVTEPNKIIIIDKVQSNPLKYSDGRRVVSLEYDITDDSKRLLPLNTNTFCSAGSIMGNGSLLNLGGAEKKGNAYAEGFESTRVFNPCSNKKCQWYENPKGLDTHRWYPTVITLFIIGGSIQATRVNDGKINSPTYEFFPKTNPNDKAIPLQFLIDTLPYNLYPIVHLMPGPAEQSHLFIFANKDSMIWDWKANKVVKKLPTIPGSPRSYPLTGTSVMLPLSPDNNYKPEVLICGGNSKDDVTSPAENSCGRIDLSNLDTAKWEMDDFGGIGRVMPDAVILADGKTLFVNGAGTGIAGYTRERNKVSIPQATNAVLTSLIYDFRKPLGSRFSKSSASTIPRYYHSVATLIPDGRVFISGGSPNENVVTSGEFKTQFQIEYYSPSYVLQTTHPRGTITSVAGVKEVNQSPIPVKYNSDVAVTVQLTGDSSVFTAALIHYGFVTHSVHMSQRYVICSVKNVKAANGVFTMDVTMPPNHNIIAPGPSWLYINNHGVPAKTAVHVMIS